MGNEFTVEFESQEDTLIARLQYKSGNLPPDLDFVHVFNSIMDRVEDPAASYRKLVINLEDMKYIQSTGISGLLHLHSRSRDLGIELELVGVDRDVISVLSKMNLDDHFNIRAK
ncbi:MAG: STAS domain-containing protein [Planctomycetota bacterium]|jgi:anti-anti-sigma factor